MAGRGLQTELCVKHSSLTQQNSLAPFDRRRERVIQQLVVVKVDSKYGVTHFEIQWFIQYNVVHLALLSVVKTFTIWQSEWTHLFGKIIHCLLPSRWY